MKALYFVAGIVVIALTIVVLPVIFAIGAALFIFDLIAREFETPSSRAAAEKAEWRGWLS